MSKVILTLMVAAQILAAADSIPSPEAKEHIGQTVAVCGVIADGRYLDTSQRKPTLLNFDKAYPNQTFTVVIFGENRAKFGAPEKELLQKEVCATGKIEEYNGKPQVVLTDPTQLQVKSK